MEKITVEVEVSDLLKIIETCPPENLIFLGGVIKKMKISFLNVETVGLVWINRCHELRMGVAVGKNRKPYFQRVDSRHPIEGSSDTPYFGVPESLGLRDYGPFPREKSA